MWYPKTMSRFGLALSLALCIPGSALAKCVPTNFHRLAWSRAIVPKTVPNGVEIYDRVWLKNPTATEFITYTVEKGAEARTGYREILGTVPTTKDELPGMKLVNGERYEFHYPENPVYREGTTIAIRAGWAHQDYPAGLVEPSTPILPPALEERIFSGKTKALAVKVPIHYYFGKKRGVIDFVFEFTRNPRYGIVDPTCPIPSPEPSPIPSAGP